jgi:GNAT superfamily N-acetyltransferase
VPAYPQTTTPDGRPAARLERAHAARTAPFERAATRVVPLDWGSAIFHDDFPRWADVNTVRVEVPAPDLDAERLHGAVERLQRPLRHRRIEVLDPATAERLDAGMAERGYESGRSVLMGWDGGEVGGDPDRAPQVEQVPYPAIESLRAEWLRDDPWAPDAETLAEGLRADRLAFATTPTRAYAVVEDGRPQAYGLLLDLGDVALVEDVYTTPSARGRGLAAAVVRRLVWESRRCGHADTVLATDADGRARALYERLGFTALGMVHRFLRRPGA